MATGSFSGQVKGLNQLQAQEQRKYGRGNYMPNVRVIYWSMRVMALTGVLMLLVAALGAWLYRKRKLERARWFQWTAIVAIAFPYIAATAGWILTEMGRQPWIVQGLLLTSKANSPSVSTTWLAISLGVFVALYLTLLVVAGGATFAAFPAWYGSMFSGYYIALLLVLVCLIVRVVSFEWRVQSTRPRWRTTWMWANTLGSFGASLIWGVGLSALLYGVP